MNYWDIGILILCAISIAFSIYAIYAEGSARRANAKYRDHLIRLLDRQIELGNCLAQYSEHANSDEQVIKLLTPIVIQIIKSDLSRNGPVSQALRGVWLPRCRISSSQISSRSDQ